MESPIYTLLSQQEAIGRKMTITANNVANMNTTGYKTHGVLFEDYIKRPSANVAHHMVIDAGTMRDTSQGALNKTDNPLDIAISGDGYFSVQTPQGTQYTRKGSFQMDLEGNLVTVDGYKVQNAGGQPITIPPNATEISIGKDGLISTNAGDAGRLSLVKFTNENALVETYGGFYQTDEAPVENNEASIAQGMLEGSNVKPVFEMTQIIEVSRAYQRVSRIIDSENERLRQVVRTLGRVV